MLIKMSPRWVSSHLFGEAGAVFRACPVASLLKGNDPRRELPELRLRRAPWVKRNYLAFPGTTCPAGSGTPRTSSNPHLSLGMISGVPRGSGCRCTICLHPWALLTLQKFHNKKRHKKENRKTRHFCAFNSAAIGNSLMCVHR